MMSESRAISSRLCLLVMAVLFGAGHSRAADPVPPMMTTLMSIFPEQRGWFVDGPLGSSPAVPDEARPFFERPRVLVPGLDGLQVAVGKLFAASGRLPLKKINRYDEKPGAEGLPGLRGIWCETENESEVGFLILTPNQNRFLIWAKSHYYPSFDNDSVPSKTRDLFARSVPDYLASIDFNVPDNRVPLASDRDLPAWMDLYPTEPSPVVASGQKLNEFMAAHAEIKIWGWSGLTAFVPAEGTINRFIASAGDTLFANRAEVLFQAEYQSFLADGGATNHINVLTRTGFDTLSAGSYIFAVDRYGRVRIARGNAGETGDRDSAQGSSSAHVNHALLFPGLDVLTAGTMEVRRSGEQPIIYAINTRSEPYFYSRIAPTIRADVAEHSERYLLSLGHLFSSLEVMRIPLSGVLVYKF